MQNTRPDQYTLIADLMTKQEFTREVQARFLRYDRLIDKDTIGLLLVDELGRNKQSVTQIAKITTNGEYTVVGTVRSLSDVRTFTRKNGRGGRVMNLDIGDETGSCRLVLWNNDIEYITSKDITPGSRVKVINGYTKQGYDGGMEINLGRWSMLEVTPTETPGVREQQATPESLSGILIRKQATKVFFKDNGDVGFVTTITVKEHDRETDLTLWDRCVKDIQLIKIGEKVTISNITKKQVNGSSELHVNGTGVIRKQN
ncbi:MAG: hypothetical protein JXA00_03520 [Candidatus Thermoplasmatota archaeon]|nr:hypothetical protein [Candidatus Thermoplasmatota archaeon]